MRFRYTLFEENKGSYLLPTDPVGWEELETAVVRGLEYHGFFYEQTASLKFYCGNGREYIEDVYNTYGIEGVIKINIGISCECEEEQPSAYSLDYSDDYANESIESCNYETFYEGVLDLQSLQFTDEYLSVSIINDNFFTSVRNNLETKVSIEDTNALNDNTVDLVSAYTTTLHGKTIVFSSKWANCNNISVNTSSSDAAPTFTTIIPIVPIQEDSGFENSSCGNEYVLSDSSVKNLLNPLYFMDATETSLNVTTDMSGSIRIFMINAGGNVVSQISLLTTSYFDVGIPQPNKTPLYQNVTALPAVGGTVLYDYDFTSTDVLNLTAGQRAYLIFEVTGMVRNLPTEPILLEVDITQDDNSTVNTSFNSIFPDTSAFTYQIHDVAKQVSRQITGNNEPFRSELLGLTTQGYSTNGEAAWNVITSGNKIRNIVKPLNTSLADVYKCVNMLYNAGLGIEKYNDEYIVRIEKKEYFYDKNAILTFDWVADIERTVAKELYYNTLNIGYDEFEIEEVNGLDEFNTQRTYNTRNDMTENNITAYSPFIGSGYAIEFTRRQSSTNDWKYDDSNFIIATNRGNLTIAEKDENFSNVTNLIDPQNVYNLRLSPTRALTRWMNVIGSSVLNFAGRLIKFTSGVVNTDLIATETTNTTGDFNNQPLSEKQDIQWNGNAYIEPIWTPEYYSFDYPLTFEQFKTIRDNAKNCIQFSKTDTDHIKGFIIECRYQPIKGLAKFKLLKAWQ